MIARPARRISRRRALVLGAGAAAAGLLAACTGGGSVPDGTATPAAAGSLAMKERPKAPAKRPPASTIRLGRLRNPGTGLPGDQGDLLLGYSRLVAVDPRGPWIVQDIARAVEQPEPLTVTFTLRESQRFHPDGTGAEQPLSADAVYADFQRRAAEGHTLFTEVIERIDRPDSKTLVLRLRAPFGLLFELLGAPGASVRGEGTYGGTTERVGSGMWVPTARGAGGSRYVANAALPAEERPLLSAIQIVAANVPSELDAAFARGEIDVRVQPVGTRPGGDQPPGATLQQRPARRMRGLGTSLLGSKNGASVRHVAAFQDARVRRAVARALDRDAVLRLDSSYPSGPVGPAHAGDAIPAEELEKHPLYRHDTPDARQLLLAAGAEGLPFRLSVPDLPLMLQIAQSVAENLQAAGFQPRLQTVPFESWQKSFLAGDFEATLFDLGALDTPDIGLRLHTTEGIAARFSLWGYSNPSYDLAVREALSSFDPRERARKSRAAQLLLLDDGPAMLPIGSTPEYASIAPGIAGYDFTAYDLNLATLSSAWSAPQRA
ncbi:MAG: ABC transporter substrate-binding protein [Dehalococcoidia bacterium]